jgi:LEA14-like dessication related protein
MHRRSRAVLAAGAGAFLAACATLGRAAFQEPVVNLRDVKVTALGMSGGSVDVLLSVYNPNGYRLDATRLTYRVMMDSATTLATGEISDRIAVQENDSTLVRVPVNFTYSGIGSAGRAIMERGSVDYQVVGDLSVGTPAGSFTVPYSARGNFSPLRGR